jgi:hypothetical protein
MLGVCSWGEKKRMKAEVRSTGMLLITCRMPERSNEVSRPRFRSRRTTLFRETGSALLWKFVDPCYSLLEDMDGDGKVDGDIVDDTKNGYLSVSGSYPTCGFPR